MYTVSVFLTVTKICFMALMPPMRPEIFTIIYNYVGVLNVCISSIVPYRLISIRATPLKKLDDNNFMFVISIISVISILLAISFILVYYLGYDILPTLLLIWRIFFISSATIEMIVLSYVAKIFWNSSRKDRFLAICVATLFMRFGIVLIIILKFLSVFPPMYMSICHMCFVILGLLTFSFKKVLERSIRQFSSSIMPTTQTNNMTNTNNHQNSLRSTHQDNKSTHQDSVRLNND